MGMEKYILTNIIISENKMAIHNSLALLFTVLLPCLMSEYAQDHPSVYAQDHPSEYAHDHSSEYAHDHSSEYAHDPSKHELTRMDWDAFRNNMHVEVSDEQWDKIRVE